MIRTLGRARLVLDALSSAAALAGGLGLAAASLFTVAAVAAAALGAPVLGDSEVIELVIGACIFAFLPYCQMRDGHIAITLFTDRAPCAVRRGLDVVAGLLAFAVAAVLAWRLAAGGLDAFGRGRTSMFLELPLWWGYAVGTVFAALWVVTAALVAAERLVEARGSWAA